jgi:hypothetical protein
MSKEPLEQPCSGFPLLSEPACPRTGSRVRIGYPGQVVGYVDFLCYVHQKVAQSAGRTITKAPR